MGEKDTIIEKIRNLLKLAEDGQNDEESQTAILLAQKLMLKHQLSKNDLEEQTDNLQIVSKGVTVYKRLFWWEKLLSSVIADNFRVMVYVQKNPLPNQISGAQKIMYMGVISDVDFALQMYHMTVKTMKYHAKHYLQQLDTSSSSYNISYLRKAYYRGFIDGLKEKFQRQISQLSSENEQYALMIKVPTQVQEAYYQSVQKKVTFKTPSFSKTDESYYEGYQKGLTTTLQQNQIENQ